MIWLMVVSYWLLAKKRKGYLKKQSQFARGQIGVKYYMKGDYEEFHALRRRKNKAKQSQFQLAPCTAEG